MTYLYATEDQDYSDYAGGRVIYSRPGAPAFPVRLVSEMFQRALQRLRPARRLRIYDPCCGGAYHLCALGFLHGEWIASILASDVDADILSLARRNVGLLTPAGLEQRILEIRGLWQQFGKESHAQALESATLLKKRLEALPGEAIPGQVFQANVLESTAVGPWFAGPSVDLVLTDIPYGWMTGWQLPDHPIHPDLPAATQMLETLLPVLAPGALVVVAADKTQKIQHEQYQRVERFQVGKRQISLLQAIV